MLLRTMQTPSCAELLILSSVFRAEKLTAHLSDAAGSKNSPHQYTAHTMRPVRNKGESLNNMDGRNVCESTIVALQVQ